MTQLGGVDGDFIGTSYYFPADKEVNSLSVYIDSNTLIGSGFIGKMLYEFEVGNISLIMTTSYYAITANDIGKWITIPFIKDGSSEFISQGQMVYVGVECYSFSSGDVNIGADSLSIHDFQNESIIRINNVYQSVNKVPFVRLNTVYSICACPCYFSSSINVSCAGNNDGSATVVAGGGVSPYTYSWNSGQTTSFATGLSAGVYTVTITDAVFDEVSCTVTITEPLDLGSYLENFDFDSVVVTGVNGTPPYSYLWSTGDTTSVLTNIICVNYYVTVTDSNNCVTTNVFLCPVFVPESKNNSIIISENYLSEKIFIENAEGYNLEIYNITGAKLLETKCSEQSSAIDVSAFVNGTYIVKAFKDNSFVYKKICIVR